MRNARGATPPDTVVTYVVYNHDKGRWIRAGAYQTQEGASAEAAYYRGPSRIYRETMDIVETREGTNQMPSR